MIKEIFKGKPTIPCTECICLAICKQKLQFECSILYDYMEENIEYDKHDRVVRYSRSWEIWNEVDKHFRRKDKQVTFNNGNPHTSRYSILSTGEWQKRIDEGWYR